MDAVKGTEVWALYRMEIRFYEAPPPTFVQPQHMHGSVCGGWEPVDVKLFWCWAENRKRARERESEPRDWGLIDWRVTKLQYFLGQNKRWPWRERRPSSPWWERLGEGAQGNVRWCNEVRQEERRSNRIEDEDGRWYDDQILTDGPFGPSPNPGAQEWEMQASLKWSCFTHKESNSLGYKH